MQAQAVQQAEVVADLWILTQLKCVVKITQVTVMQNGHNGTRPEFIPINNPTFVETNQGWYLKNGSASYPPTTTITGIVLHCTFPHHTGVVYEESWSRPPKGKFTSRGKTIVSTNKKLRRRWRKR